MPASARLEGQRLRDALSCRSGRASAPEDCARAHQKEDRTFTGGKCGEEGTIQNDRAHTCVPITIPRIIASSSEPSTYIATILQHENILSKNPPHTSKVPIATQPHTTALPQPSFKTKPNSPTQVPTQHHNKADSPTPPRSAASRRRSPTGRSLYRIHRNFFSTLHPLTSRILSTTYPKPDHRTTPQAPTGWAVAVIQQRCLQVVSDMNGAVLGGLLVSGL